MAVAGASASTDVSSKTVGVFIVTVTSLVVIANTNAQAEIRIRILSDAKWTCPNTLDRSGELEWASVEVAIATMLSGPRHIPTGRSPPCLVPGHAHHRHLGRVDRGADGSLGRSGVSSLVLHIRHGRRRSVCDLPHSQSRGQTLRCGRKTVHGHQNSRAGRSRRGDRRIRRNRGNDHSHDPERRPDLTVIRSRYRPPGRTDRRSGPL
jgi:hypothetical protein